MHPHERLPDPEVIQQTLGLLGEEQPREPFDPPAGGSRLATVVGDHREVSGQALERLHALPDSGRGPLLHRASKPPGASISRAGPEPRVT